MFVYPILTVSLIALLVLKPLLEIHAWTALDPSLRIHRFMIVVHSLLVCHIGLLRFLYMEYSC